MRNKDYMDYILTGGYVAVIAVLLFANMTFQAGYIRGGSMEPTLFEKDIVIQHNLKNKDIEKGYLKRGDIITFEAGDDKIIIKRIVGLPGETVNIKNGITIIDGKVLPESYLEKRLMEKEITEVVGRNSYFVMGDNRLDSFDSRDFHSIPEDCIIGKYIVHFHTHVLAEKWNHLLYALKLSFEHT